MVQNYLEDNNSSNNETSKQQQHFTRGGGRHRCNCFNGNTADDSSDDEFDFFTDGAGAAGGGGGSFSDASDILKGLIPCASVMERNLLADTTKIVEKNKNNHHKQHKEDLRKIVAAGLSSLGYRSSVCKSKWDKSPSFPAGEYEYVDVEVNGERVLIDVDFRSEFEIARPTAAYRAVIQSLPQVFVGNPDRLGQIVAIVSEAAKHSLKKRGMPLPPWRKAEYLKAKWLSPSFTRLNDDGHIVVHDDPETREEGSVESSGSCGGELELIFGQEVDDDPKEEEEEEEDKLPEAAVVVTWQPPAVRPKSVQRGERVVMGLASLLKERP